MRGPRPAPLPGPAEKALRDADDAVRKARQTYHDAVRQARDRLLAQLEKELAAATAGGRPGDARAVEDALRELKKADFLAWAEGPPGDPLPEDQRKVLLGRWQVQVGPTHKAVWTFAADGSVASTAGAPRGRWRCQRERHRVLITWEGVGRPAWESLWLPLAAWGAQGESHHDPRWSVRAVKLPGPAPPVTPPARPAPPGAGGQRP
jgi:hypothetical protein